MKTLAVLSPFFEEFFMSDPVCSCPFATAIAAINILETAPDCCVDAAIALVKSATCAAIAARQPCCEPKS